MIAICKREIRSYFSSPVGYVCIAALAALYGFYYFQVMYIGMSSYISAVYSTMFSFGMMIIPIITMRSMCDDQKNKTDQALLTAPVGEALHIDKAFFGTIGITADGLSTTDPGEAYTKKLMLRRAHKSILLADSGKFGCASLVASGSLRDLDIVITDRGLPPEFARLLKRNKIEVVTQ